MDKFRMMFQLLQSNQESFMSGICGIMALASAQMYSAFEFNCPCLPEYNYSYGIGLLVIPPVWFFVVGFVVNNNVSMLTEEWNRPDGDRRRDPVVLRYMLISVSQRALIAPVFWISVALMDGKSFLCAYSMDLDVTRFGNASGMSQEDLTRLMAKIPCKQIFDGQRVLSREAATRYLRCISQAFGWAFLLIITLIALMIRAIRPCFTQAAFLKTKYWSHYLDIERKMFDDTCVDHAKCFAKVGIQQYFEGVGSEMRKLHAPSDDVDRDDNEQSGDEGKLMGVRKQDAVNKVLWNWHTCRPPLSLVQEDLTNNANANANANVSAGHNGYVNGAAEFTPTIPKKQWAVYYSKV